MQENIYFPVRGVSSNFRQDPAGRGCPPESREWCRQYWNNPPAVARKVPESGTAVRAIRMFLRDTPPPGFFQIRSDPPPCAMGGSAGNPPRQPEPDRPPYSISRTITSRLLRGKFQKNTLTGIRIPPVPAHGCVGGAAGDPPPGFFKTDPTPLPAPWGGRPVAHASRERRKDPDCGTPVPAADMQYAGIKRPGRSGFRKEKRDRMWLIQP